MSFAQKKLYFMQYFIFIIKQVVYNYIGLNAYDFCIFINKIIYKLQVSRSIEVLPRLIFL